VPGFVAGLIRGVLDAAYGASSQPAAVVGGFDRRRALLQAAERGQRATGTSHGGAVVGCAGGECRRHWVQVGRRAAASPSGGGGPRAGATPLSGRLVISVRVCVLALWIDHQWACRTAARLAPSPPPCLHRKRWRRPGEARKPPFAEHPLVRGAGPSAGCTPSHVAVPCLRSSGLRRQAAAVGGAAVEAGVLAGGGALRAASAVLQAAAQGLQDELDGPVDASSRRRDMLQPTGMSARSVAGLL
jgi:hypothetical protein